MSHLWENFLLLTAFLQSMQFVHHVADTPTSGASLYLLVNWFLSPKKSGQAKKLQCYFTFGAAALMFKGMIVAKYIRMCIAMIEYH